MFDIFDYFDEYDKTHGEPKETAETNNKEIKGDENTNVSRETSESEPPTNDNAERIDALTKELTALKETIKELTTKGVEQHDNQSDLLNN